MSRIEQARKELAEGRNIWRRPSIEQMLAEYDTLKGEYQSTSAKLERAQQYPAIYRIGIPHNAYTLAEGEPRKGLSLDEIKAQIERIVNALPSLSEHPKAIYINPDDLARFTSLFPGGDPAAPIIHTIGGMQVYERVSIPPGRFIVEMKDGSLKQGRYDE